MAIVLYGPATALEAVSEIPMWVSILLIGIVGVVYTFLGGMKAVVWTDVFQSIVMVCGLVAVIIVSVNKIGGFTKMWNINFEGGRVSFFNFDMHPQTRLTFWGTVFGYGIFAASSYSDQTTVQRFCALPNIQQARRSVLSNIPCMLLCGVLTCLCGMAAYAYYQIKGCDPYRAGYISNINQILPYFVMDVLDVSGLPGLFVASVFSSSLSTLSSSLSSCAAICWEDLLKERLDHIREDKKAKITKITVLIFGVLAVMLSFFIATLKGTIMKICFLLLSSFGAPMLGIWILAGFFPFVKWKGALIGSLASVAFSLWQAYGQFFLNVVEQRGLPTVVFNCSSHIAINSSTTHPIAFSTSTITPESAQSKHLTVMEHFYALSFLWNTVNVIIVTLVIGIPISLLAERSGGKWVPDEHLFPGVARFWKSLGCRKEKMKPVFIPVVNITNSNQTIQ